MLGRFVKHFCKKKSFVTFELLEDGQLWTQTVSSTPATRQDVINLQEMLDTRLQQSQARETGICPIRRELYSQAFGKFPDELNFIRTETS